MANWIQLTSGGGYDFETALITGPFTMENDVAHPLSGLSRYVNHTREPWSVAAHSVAVARTAYRVFDRNRDVFMAGLLHDAHEAIIGDIPTPVGHHLGYETVRRLKQEVQAAIHVRLNIEPSQYPDAWKSIVDWCDAAALHVEYRQLMVPEPAGWGTPVPAHQVMLVMHEEFRRILEAYQNFGEPARDLFIQEFQYGPLELS